jgi:type I restriction enzyme R subunit
VLDALLEKYADEGIDQIEEMTVLTLQPIARHGRPLEIVNSFGGREQYLAALQELESRLYGVG